MPFTLSEASEYRCNMSCLMKCYITCLPNTLSSHWFYYYDGKYIYKPVITDCQSLKLNGAK